jgi:hypothetical protein
MLSNFYINYQNARIWKEVKDIEIEDKDSKSTLLGKAEMQTIIAIRKALTAELPRIPYLDLTSEWSIWHMSRQIRC